jgi:hypothetical protein
MNEFEFANSLIVIFMLGFMSPVKIPMMGDVQYSNMLQNMCNNTFRQDDYHFLKLKKSRFINLISPPWDIANYIVPHNQLKDAIKKYIIH